MTSTPRQEHVAFVAYWNDLVLRWAAIAEKDAESGDALLGAELATEADLAPWRRAALGVESSEETASEKQSVACATALLRVANVIDRRKYREANSDFARLHSGKTGPIAHFAKTGWAWLLNPEPDFELWWYWNTYLDPTKSDLNPYLHYLLVGRHQGLARGPEPRSVRPDAPTFEAPEHRRICLFAAYDSDNLVDDYVVDYLRELSRFADIFYLVDGTTPPDELAKLDGIVAGAWAERHGRYDFGSFSLLASKYVGWDTIEQYDELLLANDSCFLLRSLDEVFTTMNTRPVDWWGLQGTKRDVAPEYGHDSPVPLADLDQVRGERERWNPYFRFHVSSYFLAFRRRVVADPGFRARINDVAAQKEKGQIVRKYEIGLSDYLVTSGFSVDTFVDGIYPFHPLYNAEYFTLLNLGFPLLKRNFIGENTLLLPDLYQWKERVLEANPDANVEQFERNIIRATPDNAYAQAMRVRTRPDGTVDAGVPMRGRSLRAADLRAPKFDHWWAFPVCGFDHTFAGNERAIFEEVRDDPTIKKIILTRSRRVEAEGENVVVVPLDSPEGQHYLLRAGFIFVKHGPRVNVPFAISPGLHRFINTWHGIPLKRFGPASKSLEPAQLKSSLRSNSSSWAVLSSSKIDALAMSAAFFPASYPDLWQTGLPRNDFVLRPDEQLPADLRASVDRLRAELNGRRLAMFLPTFKDGQADAYYPFSPSEVARLQAWCEENNAVIGVREHMADKARTYSRLLAPLNPLDLSAKRYPDLEVLYRAADLLISDYSSCLVDFMLTGKPLISFAYDFDNYSDTERGLFYDLDEVLPGPVCRTFTELDAALGRVFVEPDEAEREEYAWRRRIFHDHVDDQASWRVVQRVRELALESTI